MTTLTTRRGGIKIELHRSPDSATWEAEVEPRLQWFQKPYNLRSTWSSTQPTTLLSLAIQVVDEWLGLASEADLAQFWAQIEASTMVRDQRSRRLVETGELTYGYPLSGAFPADDGHPRDCPCPDCESYRDDHIVIADPGDDWADALLPLTNDDDKDN